MKQNLRIEKVCFVFMLVVAVQISLLLIMRITSPTNDEGQDLHLAKKTCNTSFSNTWALIQSQQGGPIICDRSHDNYDWCFLNRPSILDPNTTTFSTVRSNSQNSTIPLLIEKIRPYPRKWEKFTMSLVSEITLTTSSIDKVCQIYHETPALVFSVSGYTGNFFHDFNDGIIPLYVTINTLFPNQDVTLVITNFKNWWYSKYEVLLNTFTRHPIVNLDNQTATHCFPLVAVGLISHGPMTIQPIDHLYHARSFHGFRSLLEIAYSKCPVIPLVPPLVAGKPRLVFMGRTGNVGRVILNQKEIIEATKKAGFDVVLFQPTKFTYLCDAYRLINASHGIIGVHGAALTHSLFLRPRSLFIQIVPIGNEWLADSYFKNLANGLSFKYVEYKIRAEESSLAGKYGLYHEIVRNPNKIIRGNWSALDSIYLKGQDVKLDLSRFSKYLVIAYSKAKRFMDNSG
ncbi:xylan glycosyltransferase MUCI21-like [Beta vulgaris subsp. vulgaris]|uniref:xylan glycosyltransferase MUCI21-like n=1 Tax=Beta vulgaris subsp. vulgaris TaxID=3555 RepID=UPI00254676FC|nr:xylan glycosyltransferase MUCI21-like [Beta vulgaris subsp. vulgaris]